MLLYPTDATAAKVIDWHVQTATEGKGGQNFASGCNLSGVRTVHIYVGPYQKNKLSPLRYPSLIKRIYFEFHESNKSDRNEKFLIDSNTWKEESHECKMCTKETTKYTIDDITTQNPIVKIDVWTIHRKRNKRFVTAVRFTTANIEVYKYGDSSHFDSNEYTVTTYQGEDRSCKLVGIHGRARRVLDSVGFAFASVAVADRGGQSLHGHLGVNPEPSSVAKPVASVQDCSAGGGDCTGSETPPVTESQLEEEDTVTENGTPVATFVGEFVFASDARVLE